MGYEIILADPPWEYRAWSKAGNGRSAESHYKTMGVEDLARMKIPAAKDAVLFMWATWPTLPDALKLIEAWGFTYKTQAWTWLKANPLGLGHFMGMGYYTRANTEPCLLATKGNPGRPVDKGVISLIYAPVLEHSRKPNDQYRKINLLYPNRSKLELFARRKYPGWDAWGNEIESDVKIEWEGA